jgi:hypothetical protein
MANAIQVAALWWADKLQRDRATQERFAKALESAIIKAFEEEENTYLRPRPEVCVKTDYDPQDLLWGALEAAGVEMPKTACNTCRELLPYKTCMWVGKDHVNVSYGRGAPFEDLPIPQEDER